MVGPSGSGKSLFLRALADLDPNEGDLRLDGESREAMSGPQWRRRVTYVAGESGWWDDDDWELEDEEEDDEDWEQEDEEEEYGLEEIEKRKGGKVSWEEDSEDNDNNEDDDDFEIEA